MKLIHSFGRELIILLVMLVHFGWVVTNRYSCGLNQNTKYDTDSIQYVNSNRKFEGIKHRMQPVGNNAINHGMIYSNCLKHSQFIFQELSH
jgi:hypothetical protein